MWRFYVEVVQHEEVVARLAGGPLFENCTHSALI